MGEGSRGTERFPLPGRTRAVSGLWLPEQNWEVPGPLDSGASGGGQSSHSGSQGSRPRWGPLSVLPKHPIILHPSPSCSVVSHWLNIQETLVPPPRRSSLLRCPVRLSSPSCPPGNIPSPPEALPGWVTQPHHCHPRPRRPCAPCHHQTPPPPPPGPGKLPTFLTRGRVCPHPARDRPAQRLRTPAGGQAALSRLLAPCFTGRVTQFLHLFHS